MVDSEGLPPVSGAHWRSKVSPNSVCGLFASQPGNDGAQHGNSSITWYTHGHCARFPSCVQAATVISAPASVAGSVRSHWRISSKSMYGCVLPSSNRISRQSAPLLEHGPQVTTPSLAPRMASRSLAIFSGISRRKVPLFQLAKTKPSLACAVSQ